MICEWLLHLWWIAIVFGAPVFLNVNSHPETNTNTRNTNCMLEMQSSVEKPALNKYKWFHITHIYDVINRLLYSCNDNDVHLVYLWFELLVDWIVFGWCFRIIFKIIYIKRQHSWFDRHHQRLSTARKCIFKIKTIRLTFLNGVSIKYANWTFPCSVYFFFCRQWICLMIWLVVPKLAFVQIKDSRLHTEITQNTHSWFVFTKGRTVTDSLLCILVK